MGVTASLPPIQAEPACGPGVDPTANTGCATPDNVGDSPAGPHRDPGRDPRQDEDALHVLAALVERDIEACNRTIVARMDSPVALIPQLAAHIVAAGGKRLRPLLTLAAARLCG